MGITMAKITNASSLSPADTSTLQELVAHAANSAEQVGDAPTEAAPSTHTLKSLDLFDSVEWSRCLECPPCIRHVPQHWQRSIWEARLAVARSIVDTYERSATADNGRLWKLFSLFDVMVLGATRKTRGGRRGQGYDTLNALMTRRLRAFWAGLWTQLLTDADASRVLRRRPPAAAVPGGP